MTLLVITPLSGCNDIEQKDNEVKKVLSNVYSIRITDVVADMYSTQLQLSLSEAETKNLVAALSDAPGKQTSFSGYLYYSFELYDKENRLLDRITIDTLKTIKFDSGKILKRTNELDSVIKSIENNHKITMDIWKRAPGENYFSLFDLVDHGQIYEITENNFVDGLKVNLNKDDCLSIADLTKHTSFSNDNFEFIDKKYIFSFYTIDGATIYTLYLDENSQVFTEYGYRINSESLCLKLKDLIDK